MRKISQIILLILFCLLFFSCQIEQGRLVNVDIDWIDGNTSNLETSVDVVNIVDLKTKLKEIEANYIAPKGTLVGEWKLLNEDGSLGKSVNSLRTVTDGMTVSLVLGSELNNAFVANPVTIKFIIGPDAYFLDSNNNKLVDSTRNLITSFEAEAGMEYVLPKNVERPDYDLIYWSTSETSTIEITKIIPKIGEEYTYYANWLPKTTWDGKSSDVDSILKKIKEAEEDGTFSIKIETANELAGLSKITRGSDTEKNSLSGYTVILENDIDLNEMEWVPISFFSGTFDGNNKVISNLRVTTSSNYTGLFGNISDVVLKNIGLENAYVTRDFVMGRSGALAAYVSGESKIINCYATGEVVLSTSAFYTGGGLIGTTAGTDVKIIACYSGLTIQELWGGTILGQLSGGSGMYGCYSTVPLGAVRSAATNKDLVIEACYSPSSTGGENTFEIQEATIITVAEDFIPYIVPGLNSWADVAVKLNESIDPLCDYKYIENPDYEENGTGKNMFPLIVVEK